MMRKKWLQVVILLKVCNIIFTWIMMPSLVYSNTKKWKEICCLHQKSVLHMLLVSTLILIYCCHVIPKSCITEANYGFYIQMYNYYTWFLHAFAMFTKVKCFDLQILISWLHQHRLWVPTGMFFNHYI